MDHDSLFQVMSDLPFSGPFVLISNCSICHTYDDGDRHAIENHYECHVGGNRENLRRYENSWKTFGVKRKDGYDFREWSCKT